MDPKKTIEKLSRYAKNPQFADHSEKIEQTEHLASIADALKNPTKPVFGDFVQSFLDHVKGESGDKGDQGEKPVYGKDYLTDEEVESIKKEITPKLGEDYFTPAHINQITNQIKASVRDEVRPIKGIHYDDGKDGEDGKDADVNGIVEAVLAKIPKPKNGRDGRDSQFKIEDVVKATLKHLTNLKGDERPSLKMFRESDDLIGSVALHKNMMRNMPKSLLDGDQRWGGHGGGGTNSVNFIDNEIISGNGTSWILANIPITGSVQLIGPGIYLYPGNDPVYGYSISGKNITTQQSFVTGDLLANYRI